MKMTICKNCLRTNGNHTIEDRCLGTDDRTETGTVWEPMDVTKARVVDGEFTGLTAMQREIVEADFMVACEELDCVQPTLEAWLAATYYDMKY